MRTGKSPGSVRLPSTRMFRSFLCRTAASAAGMGRAISGFAGLPALEAVSALFMVWWVGPSGLAMPSASRPLAFWKSSMAPNSRSESVDT